MCYVEYVTGLTTWLEHVLTSDLDECRAVPHPWKFEVSERGVGGGDQSWDQIQQVPHCIQELDVKQGQRLWEGHQINTCRSANGRAVLLPQWDSRRFKKIPLRNNRWVVICCVLQFFGATSYRDISFLSYIKEQDEHPARGVQRKKKKLEKLEKLNSNVSFLKSDPITQDDPQTLLWAVSCRNHFLSKQPRRRKCASTHGQEAGWLS